MLHLNHKHTVSKFFVLLSKSPCFYHYSTMLGMFALYHLHVEEFSTGTLFLHTEQTHGTMIPLHKHIFLHFVIRKETKCMLLFVLQNNLQHEYKTFLLINLTNVEKKKPDRIKSL